MDGQPSLQQLISSLISTHLRPGDRFYLVVVPDGGRPEVRQFDTLDGLVAGIRELEGQPVSVIPFCGMQFRISKGPWRHLLTPFGNVPLYTLPDGNELEADEVGYLGDLEEAALNVVEEPPPGLVEGDEEEELEEGVAGPELEEGSGDLSGEEVFGEP